MSRELSPEADAARESRVFRLYRILDLDIGYGSVSHIPVHAGSKAMTFPADPDFSTLTYYAFIGVLGRAPTTAEQTSWLGLLDSAYASSLAGLITQVSTLVHGLFVSGAYTALNRTNSGFVYDCFAGYLDRLPDVGGYEYWLGQLDSLALTRNDVLTQFESSLEFTDRITALTIARKYPGDLRNVGSWVLIDSSSADQGSVEVQTIESARNAVVGGVLETSVIKNFIPTILGDPSQRIHPIPAKLSAVIEMDDGSFWIDPIITGYADVSSADYQTAKFSVVSDMSRDDLDVTKLCSQRCSHVYKGPGCDSPDPSPTCSRIFDDTVNGCASKMPAPQIIDSGAPNNQPSFGGVPPMRIQSSPATVGVNGFPVDPPFLDPNDPILHRRPFDDGTGLGAGGILPFGGLLM